MLEILENKEQWFSYRIYLKTPVKEIAMYVSNKLIKKQVKFAGDPIFQISPHLVIK